MYFQCIATTQSGLEHILSDELKNIGAIEPSILRRAVSFKADKEILYKANMYCRTALHILKPIETFIARNEQELYTKAMNIDWRNYLQLRQTFAFDFAVHSPYFQHSQYAALKTKDALADFFRQKTGARPSVNTQSPDVQFHLHISEDKVTISTDSSGQSLHKRGYRIPGHPAPLNEVLAAGLIYLSEWDKESSLTDLMCGSGTILIEAALMAQQIYPCLLRNKYAFQNWEDYDAQLFSHLMLSAQQNMLSKNIIINGSDINEKTIYFAKQNAEKAGLKNEINFSVNNFKDIRPNANSGTIIMNPPYGERLEEKNISDFYKMMGDTFKNNYSGYTVWVLSANKEALKSFGLRPSKKITLFNGPLECKFLKFELYSGSRKSKYSIL